ncbi:hypothetical protein ABPG74_013477 [Tetrahymena malaccensis]
MNKFIICLALVGFCTAANFICTPEMKQNKNCSREYNPVCGVKMDPNKSSKYSSIKSTYSNKCIACSEEDVEFYAEGSCEQYPKIAAFCHPDAHLNKGCTKEFFPTCGLFDDSVICQQGPCGSNYSNKCVACINQEVSYILPGYCHLHEQYQP